MSAAWTSGTDGNIFPLYRSTVFKLNFKESLKQTPLRTCSCQRASVTQQTSLKKIPDRLPERKLL